MDPDAEFNSLTALYQSVVHDMKLTYPGWESVSQKAIKLASQIKATAQCLSSFVDAVQVVSDHANNLKGASRDVGACVTRMCMRERALESRLRSWADALGDEMAVSLQQRAGYWKARTNELDKSATKHVKKVRSRKQRPDLTALNEQRTLCSQILAEQRGQFAFFIGTLMPVLNAQISALDEGGHIRQVAESLENTVKHVDTEKLVTTIVSDVCQGADSAWRQCLAAAGQSWKASEENFSIGSIRDLSTRPTTRSSNYSLEERDIGPAGIDIKCRTTSIASSFPPPESVCSDNSTAYIPPHFSKPPLQRRGSEKSVGNCSIVSHNERPAGTFLQTMTNGVDIQNQQRFQSFAVPPPYHHVVNQRSIEQFGAKTPAQRPQSFNGVLRPNYASPSSCIGTTPIFGQPMTNSSCSSSDAASSSALLIAETLQQIDQLGSDLENYCTANDTRLQKQLSQSNISRVDSSQNGAFAVDGLSKGRENGTNADSQPSQGPVRIRTMSSGSRPPPPVRRSSQITTSTTPSVAEVRMGGGSMMGSRQSLNSSTLYSQHGSSQDLYTGNVGRSQAANYRI